VKKGHFVFEEPELKVRPDRQRQLPAAAFQLGCSKAFAALRALSSQLFRARRKRRGSERTSDAIARGPSKPPLYRFASTPPLSSTSLSSNSLQHKLATKLARYNTNLRRSCLASIPSFPTASDRPTIFFTFSAAIPISAAAGLSDERQSM
jgi:hypothetical protein